MKIVRLENEQNEKFALEIPLQEEYIKIKRYEPYGQPVDKKTITTITEDMYIEWEINADNILDLVVAVWQCLKCGIYTTSDILKYQRHIETQFIYDLLLKVRYYDTRTVHRLEQKSLDFQLVQYKADNVTGEIQDDIINSLMNLKRPIFWLEAYCATDEQRNSYICIRIDKQHMYNVSRVGEIRLDELYYFVLNKNTRDIFLEACRVLGAVRMTYYIFLVPRLAELYSMKAFNIEDKSMVESRIALESDGSTVVTIAPVSNKELVIKDIYDPYVFCAYNLVFKNCGFELNWSKIVLCKKTICFEKCTFHNSVHFDYKIFKKDIIFQDTIFENTTSFINTVFGNKSNFLNVTFKKGVDFHDSIFEKQVSFQKATFGDYTSFNNVRFLNDADFVGTHFEDGAYFANGSFGQNAYFQSVTFHSNANFNNAKFQTEKVAQTIADFSGSHFKERAFFTESHFHKKTNFSNVTFDHNAYFDKAKFEKEANFSQAEFYKNAHFYGTEFEEFPNFIQVIFNENVNFINTKSNIKFEKVKEQIERLQLERKTNYENQTEEDREDKEEPKEHKIANEFRDSFRTIKSALIKDNNMLDASNYHRIELYCKELELEHKRKQTAEESDFRDTVDRIQLMFYRLTSDHHTKLLMILNNVIFLIALFGIANLVLCLCNKICTTTISPLVEIIVSIIFVSIAICFLFECCKKLIFCIMVLVDICALLIICSQLHLAFVVVVMCYMVLIFFVLLGCAMCCSDKICACEIKKCIFAFSYLMVMFMLFTTPSSILPILGKLIENKSGEVCLFVVGNVKLLCCGGTSYSQTLNLIYMLFLFLLLWSLQKTARKNTIVPS